MSCPYPLPNFNNPYDPLSPAYAAEPNLISFAFLKANNAGQCQDFLAILSGTNGTIIMPTGVDSNALIATFAISPGATAYIGEVMQVSNSTSADYSGSVGFKVVSRAGRPKIYTISILRVPYTSNAAITSFALSIGGTLKAASLSGTSIGITVPFGTDTRALVASFTLYKESSIVRVHEVVQVSGQSPNDFASPVEYVVTAEDGSTQSYLVTLSVQEASSLIFSEYYEGASGNNKYIELTNTSAAAVDLSEYSIRMYQNGSSATSPNLNPQTARTLGGILRPGKSVVYVADGYVASILDTVDALSSTVGNAEGWKMPIPYTYTQTSINFTVNDCLELMKGDTAMDFIGELGTLDNGGANIKMIRKPGATGRQDRTWDITVWKTIPVLTASTYASEDDTAGSHDSVASGSRLTDCMLGGYRATITGVSIYVCVPQGTDVSNLAFYFIGSGESLKMDGNELTNGVSLIDLSGSATSEALSPDAGTRYTSYLVASTSNPASSTTYALDLVVSSSQVYTATNYDFSGGIAAVFDQNRAEAGITYNLDGSGGFGGYTGLVNSAVAYEAGVSNIQVQGFNDTDRAISLGDQVKFEGETCSPWHTVTSTTRSGGVTAEIFFTPPIAAGWIAYNMAVTVGAYCATTTADADSGASSISIGNIDDSAHPIAVGDWFQIAGETGSPWHRVEDSAQSGGKTTQLSFIPALKNSIAAAKDLGFCFNPGQVRTLSGVVTAIVSPGQIYIQDREAAICLYKAESFSSVRLGDKITISGCIAGKVYNGRTEITEFAPILGEASDYDLTRLSSGNAIFYSETTGWDSIADLMTRRYCGYIGASAGSSSPFAGTFTSSDSSSHSFRANGYMTATYFTANTSYKHFYGIIDIDAGTSYMLLISPDQRRD